MKKQEKEEVPLLLIERNPLVLLVSLVICSLFVYWGYTLLKDVNPRGFLVMVPAGIVLFHSLWLLLNPFALIFDDRIEIRQSLIHHKMRHFIDIEKLSQNKEGRLFISYRDGEVEKLNLFGIKKQHKELLKDSFNKQILLRRPAGS